MILYRDKWGTTRWTRVEETAIRNRGFDHGYEFVVMVMLDGRPPDWLPKTFLYANYQRFGAEGTAQAIDSRLEGMGVPPAVETLKAQAQRLAREQEEDNERQTFLATKGIDASLAAAIGLVDTMEERAGRLNIEVERNRAKRVSSPTLAENRIPS